MLQIKKKATLVWCAYSLQFTFRNTELHKQYFLRKQKTQSIFLRSPKHFNIGKQKITNLNYKTINLLYKKTSPFFFNAMINPHPNLFNVLSRKVQDTPVLYVNSMKLRVKTSFKITWLEI